jgi:hypothetical protein
MTWILISITLWKSKMFSFQVTKTLCLEVRNKKRKEKREGEGRMKKSYDLVKRLKHKSVKE